MADLPIAVNDATVTVEATANEQAAFAFDFPVYEAEHLRVYLEGVLLTLTTHYTVSGLEDADGGTVTLVEAIADTVLDGDEVTITRSVPIERIADYQNAGDFRAETINRELDMMTMWSQELKRDVASADAAIALLQAADEDHDDRLDALETVALGNGNFVVASQAEAEAGTDNTKGMTPLRVSQAITRRLTSVDIRDYDATLADGSGDISDALNAAYAALALNGSGTVVIPNGAWTMSEKAICSGNKIRTYFCLGAEIAYDTADDIAFAVSGDDCWFDGPGLLEGPEEWDAGDGSSQPTYGVVFVTGEGFVATGLRLLNIKRLGIACVGVTNVQIKDCDIDGNQPSPTFPITATFHFGIFLDAGAAESLGNFQVQGNKIRNCTQGVGVQSFGGGPFNQRSFVAVGDTFEGMWDHAYYTNYTGGGVISSATFHRCHLPIAMSGPNNIVKGVTHYTEETADPDQRDVASTVSMRDPVNCIVSGVSIVGHGDSISGETVIGVDLISVEADPLENNVIENISMKVLTGKAQAVRITSANGVHRNIISNIAFTGGVRDGLGVVEISGASSGNRNNQVSNINAKVTSGDASYGLSISKGSNCLVEGVTYEIAFSAGSAQAHAAVALIDCNDCRVDNTMPVNYSGTGTNITLYGVREFTAGLRNEVNFVKPTIGGSVTAIQVGPITGTSKLLFRSAGEGAPTFAVRAGSEWNRTDGGAGTSKYINQGDGNTWAAVTP